MSDEERRDEGMYCSTCGSPVPRGRTECGTCGTMMPAARPPARAHAGPVAADDGANPVTVFSVGVCPRCAYQGQGLPYFTRGPNMAALVGATLFTLPYALGAGGFLYYGLRRDHKVCPRCGHGWGKFGEMAGRQNGSPTRPPRAAVASAATEQHARVWSIILMILAALAMLIGVVEFEMVLVGIGMIAGGSGFFLHRVANRAREERRVAMIASLQTPVLQLAAERNGLLTVTDVAAKLGWPLRRAEKVLESLNDGWRVNSDVTSDGLIVYEFREITLGMDRLTEPGVDRLAEEIEDLPRPEA